MIAVHEYAAFARSDFQLRRSGKFQSENGQPGSTHPQAEEAARLQAVRRISLDPSRVSKAS